MGLPTRFSFEQNNREYITWGLGDGLLVDGAGKPVPVNDATVTATLYKSRNSRDVAVKPGTPVTGCIALPLPFVAESDGLYRERVDTAGWPVSPSYTLVIDATTPDGAMGHWEIPAEVRPRTT